jgi:hypothetical protein
VTRYRYRPDVLDHLWRHGVQPRDTTPPGLVRDFVNDLYRYELRKLRDRLLVGDVPREHYYQLVVDMRNKYPVLALKAWQWLIRE